MKDNRLAVGRVFLLAALLPLLWPGCTTADTLRIATWNIYFLYDEIDDGGVFPSNRIPREEADFRNLASVMAQINADIWALASGTPSVSNFQP